MAYNSKLNVGLHTLEYKDIVYFCVLEREENLQVQIQDIVAGIITFYRG